MAKPPDLDAYVTAATSEPTKPRKVKARPSDLVRSVKLPKPRPKAQAHGAQILVRLREIDREMLKRVADENNLSMAQLALLGMTLALAAYGVEHECKSRETGDDNDI